MSLVNLRWRLLGRLPLLFAILWQPVTCSGDILGGDFKFNGVFRFDDVTGEEVAGGIPSGVPAGSAGLQATAGVTVGPDGNIYVASQNTGEVLFYDGATGAPLPSPLPGGHDGLFAIMNGPDHENGAPGPVRFGPDGNLYVADFGGSTVRVFHGTTGVELAPAATGLGPPGGLTFAPNGDLYVGNFGTSAIIRVRNGVQQTFIASGTGPILTPSSMLLVPNGDLLVVSMFANEIHRYSAAGAYLGVFAAIEPVPPPVDVTNYPAEIAFDADGNVVVAVLGATNPPDNRGQILRFALNEGMIAGTLLDTLVDGYPPISSVAWIRSPDAITGDFNNDGTIDADDFAKWQGDFGKWVAKGGGADGDGNGIIDAADYVVWRDALAGATLDGIVSSVPEPASTVHVLLTISFALVRRIRWQTSRF